MTAPLNGHSVPPPEAIDPTTDIANAVYLTNWQEGDPTWAELTEDERAALAEYADGYIIAHTGWLQIHGFRIIPPGAVPTPKSEQEALGMIQAAKNWFDAAKRKQKLVGTAKKLILPGRTH